MRLNTLAVVLAVALAAAVALGLLWSDADRSRWTEPKPMPPSLDEVAAAAATEPADVSRYRETLERPLFAATRKIGQRSDSPGEGQAQPDPLKDIRLLGTYGAGDRGGIIVINGGKVQRLPVGSAIGDWKVAGEEGRGAAFVRASGERRQLELALNTTAPTAPASGAKAAAPTAAAAPAPEAAASRAADRSQAVAARRAADDAAVGSPQSSEAQEQLKRERLERINTRRAQRGLPPLKE
jgi:lipoprotein NlpD